MTFLTKKHLHRRTLLRGAGVAISLPLLDAMLPAASAAPASVRRIGFVYVPNGIIMNEWLPSTTGADFDMKRVLKPMEPFKSDITVLSGLYNHAAADVEGGAHAKASGSFLSGKPPKHTAGADVHSGVTFDQIAANHWAAETRVPSLQLGCEDSRMVGNCDTGSSCAYTNTLSWKDADTPLMVEVNPRSVFERLFGNVDMSLSAEVRARRALYRKSILDETQENAQSLVAGLGAADKRKLDQYLTAIREVEQRIIDSEQNPLMPSIDKPAGIPFVFSDYVKLMFDLQVVAFQSDLCRVSTIMLGREGSVRTYPEIGVPDPHHPLTHHRGHPDFIEKVTKINVFHAELFSYFLQRLKETEEGDGSLLDHSAILYGGALSEGNGHSNENLPLVLAGAAGGLRGGRHVAAQPQPVANLFVDILNRGGIETEAFGDSTGRLDVSA
jgi:hypothetical protein